jgi:hypothetical protein
MNDELKKSMKETDMANTGIIPTFACRTRFEHRSVNDYQKIQHSRREFQIKHTSLCNSNFFILIIIYVKFVIICFVCTVTEIKM